MEKIIWNIMVGIAAVTLALAADRSSTGQSAEPKPTPTPTPLTDTRDLTGYGIVDLDGARKASADQDERRKRINSKYDGEEWVLAKINGANVGGIGRTQDLEPPPLLPCAASDLIVIGRVGKAEAFLSNDRKGVYTEFTIRVSETFKTSGEAVEAVVADRMGGVVRYPNGQRVVYASSERLLPSVGSDYLFFLAKRANASNFSILASYQLLNGKANPLEDRARDGNSGVREQTTLLNDLRTGIQTGNCVGDERQN